MNANELLILKAYQIREINVTSTFQKVKFKLSDESEIEVTLTNDRRLLVQSLKLGQPLNIKPISATSLEIFPELPENYYHVEQPPEIILPKKIVTKSIANDEKVINEKCDVYGVTASKMTMKEKPKGASSRKK